MTQRQLIESTAADIIAAIREHGPTCDVIIPRINKFSDEILSENKRLRAVVKEIMQERGYNAEEIDRTLNPRPWGMVPQI